MDYVTSLILVYLPPIILGLVGVISLFFYFRTRKAGFAPIGVGVLLQGCLPFIHLGLFTIFAHTYERRLIDYIELFTVVNAILSIIPPILVLIGLLLLRNEFRSKPTLAL